MFGQRFRPPRFRDVGDITGPADTTGKTAVDRHQRPVAGDLENLAVNFLVEPEIGHQFVSRVV